MKRSGQLNFIKDKQRALKGRGYQGNANQEYKPCTLKTYSDQYKNSPKICFCAKTTTTKTLFVCLNIIEIKAFLLNRQISN